MADVPPVSGLESCYIFPGCGTRDPRLIFVWVTVTGVFRRGVDLAHASYCEFPWITLSGKKDDPDEAFLFLKEAVPRVVKPHKTMTVF